MIYSHKDPLLFDILLPVLDAGDIFVYPTDTIYGFGVRADSTEALDKLYELKKRPQHMPLSMLVSGVDAIGEYALLPGVAKPLADHFLPGALTLVLPAEQRRLPSGLYSDSDFLGFRVPAHPFCLQLMNTLPYPVITTSVNRSGQAPLNTMSEIQKHFSGEVGIMICDEELERRPNPMVSTVIRIDRKGRVSLLREGSILFDDIRAFISEHLM
jgi:L-threonylcarbamoyladenylate synthase